MASSTPMPCRWVPIFFMRDSRCADRVVMVFAHVGGGLDLRGAILAGLDLSGATIVGDLALGAPGAAVWKGKNGEPGNDPKREHLKGWQSFIFSVIAIIGFVLAPF